MVLNALRHQRFGTLPDNGVSSCTSSAQRLTASEVWHYSLFERDVFPLAVLNALRHQRFGTELVNYAVGVNLDVLNALRHQRFGTCVILN